MLKFTSVVKSNSKSTDENLFFNKNGAVTLGYLTGYICRIYIYGISYISSRYFKPETKEKSKDSFVKFK